MEGSAFYEGFALFSIILREVHYLRSFFLFLIPILVFNTNLDDPVRPRTILTKDRGVIIIRISCTSVCRAR